MKYLLFAIMVFVLTTGKVSANTYSTVVSDTATKCDTTGCGVPAHTIIIRSNDLENVVKVQAYSPMYGDIYIDDEYQIYSEKLYEYHLYNSNNSEVKTLNGEIEILVKDDNLVEGTEYNVYYFGIEPYSTVLDKTRIGDKAEVVKIDGELYIRLVTDTIQTFGLEQDVSEEYKTEFNKIAENGYYIFPAIKPKQTSRDGFDFWSFFGIVAKGDLPYEIWPASEYKLDAKNYYMTLEFDSLPGEKHIVEYKWQEEDIPNYLKKEINEIEKNIATSTESLSDYGGPGNGVYFAVEDLNFVNYIYNNYKGFSEEVIPYSSDIKRIFKYNNFKYHFDFRAGNPTPFYNILFGYLLIEKDELLYSTMLTTGVAIKPVIYISDNTADNDNAYMEAAIKRIKDYLQIDNVSIEVAGRRSDLTDRYNELARGWSKIYNEDKLSDNYYTININGTEVDFVIEKNTQKAKEMEFKTKDIDSNVEINTTSGLVPHDTSIEVEIIGKDHKKYQKILEYLGKDNADIYDLKLFSESKDQYITKLPNGKFKVRIPLKDEYKNSELQVYYADDDGNKETYSVTVEDGYAIFETTHFSTYALVAEDGISNPNTLDNISLYFMFGMISILGMIVTAFIMKKDIIKN